MTAPPALAGSGNPYRGLAAWEAEHRATFFGRGAETRAALERLKSDGALVITGESGAGKSSLARAGVVPAVREGALQDGRVWKAITVLPGRQPLATLLEALATSLGAAERELRAAVDESALALVREVRRRLQPREGLLVFVDQLEELVTLAEPAEALAVASVLAELSRRVPGLALLATVRHDLLARLGTLGELGHDVARCLLLLGPIEPRALTDVVTGPALSRGVVFEDDAAVQRLLGFMRGGGGLPLLQFTLASLWEARDTRRNLIPSAALDALGGPEGALGRYADGVVERLEGAGQRAARSALVRLVGEGDTRVRLADTELSALERTALGQLVQARLVVARDTPSGPAWELAHEALAREWTTLRRWLSEDEALQAVRQRLSTAAHEWERLGRRSDALWSGPQLAESALLATTALSERDEHFLAASRRTARLRRLRLPAVGLAIAVTAASAWGVVRWMIRPL